MSGYQETVRTIAQEKGQQCLERQTEDRTREAGHHPPLVFKLRGGAGAEGQSRGVAGRWP